MNIQQATTSLSTVGTVDFCNVSGQNDAFFIIALSNFNYSTASLNTIVVAIETHIKDVYPTVDNWTFSENIVKIQLSKSI